MALYEKLVMFDNQLYILSYNRSELVKFKIPAIYWMTHDKGQLSSLENASNNVLFTETSSIVKCSASNKSDEQDNS